MNPISTPWGPSQGIQFYDPARQIAKVHTAEHGGYRVSTDLTMPAPLAAVGLEHPDLGPYLWFEEDCAWSAVVIAFPQWFLPGLDAQAQDTLRNALPEAYEAHYGVKLSPEQSQALAQRAWEQKTAGNFTVITGYSDRHWNVPAGHVYVVGWRRCDEAARGFLLTTAEYDAVIKNRGVLDGYPSWEPDRSVPQIKPSLEVIA